MKDPHILLEDLLAHDAWIRRLASRLVADEPAAEDLAQDAWVEALNRPPARTGRPQAWLRQVLRSLAFSRQRSEISRRNREEAVAKPVSIPSAGDILERETTRLRVARMVYSLEEPYRTTILYRYFENMPPRRIAARLDVSVVAVETRLRRGLQQLRARLDREFGDRKRWCTALLPLTLPTAAKAAAATATSSLTGALVMSMKIKIGIAVLVALGVAYAFWPRDGMTPPLVPESEADKSERAVAKTAQETGPAEETAEITEKEPEVHAELLSLEPERGSIVGRVVNTGGAPISGAAVKAFRYSPGAVEMKALLATFTNRDGRYVLKPLEVRCVVEVSAAGYHAGRALASPFMRRDFVLGKPGILSGRIVMAAKNSPCVDSTVAVYEYRPADILDQPGNYAWRRPPVVSTRSNRAGEYSFPALRPGLYQIRIIPADAPMVHSTLAAIEIVAGEETTRDFAVGSGCTVVGKVTDRDSGQPVAGAEVFFRGNPRRKAVTDKSGRYELSCVFLGSFPVVLTTARGFFRPVPSSLRPAELGAEIVHDIVMQRTAFVSGRVLGPDGGPVSGARVGGSESVLRTVEDLEGSAKQDTYTCTDEEGMFELAVFRPGRARRVYAARKDLAWSASEPFTMAPGERTEGVVIRLEAGEKISGRVTTETGSAVASAQVTLYAERQDPRSRRTYHRMRGTTYSRVDGRYEFTGVRSGTYKLEIVPPGILTENHSPYTAEVRQGLVVAEGGQTRINVVLQRGPFVAGRVVDESGRPLENVVVKALPKNKGVFFDFRHWAPCSRVVTTDGQGRFRIEGLRALGQPYSLLALKKGFDITVVNKVDPGQAGLHLVLRELKELEGRVCFTATGKPATEFRIHGSILSGPSGRKPPRLGWYTRPSRNYADLEGRFALALLPGTYQLEAQIPDGQRSDPRTVEVPVVGRPGPIEFTVRPGASVFGKVFTRSGNPAGVVRIRVFSLDSSPPRRLREVVTDKRGLFDLRSLPGGALLLYTEGSENRTRLAVTRRIEVQVGDRREIKLTLGPGVEVVVTVRDSGGKSVEGSRVTINRADRLPIAMQLTWDTLRRAFLQARRQTGTYPGPDDYARWRKNISTRLTTTDADGKLAPLLLLPGDYVIEAAAPGHKRWKKTVRVTSGVSRALGIVLQKE